MSANTATETNTTATDTAKQEAAAPEKKRRRRRAPNASANKGVDARNVFVDVIKADFDLTQVQTADLIFGEREKDGVTQIVSIVDTAVGKVDVYPVVSRYQPTLGVPHRCHVVYREKKWKGAKGEVKVTTGYAMPMNLREAKRDGEWKDVGNNILELTFEPSRDEEKGGWVAKGPAGKRVILPKESGIEPNGKQHWMCAEYMGYYMAHCQVDPKAFMSASNATKALVVQAETVGAILNSVDVYGITLGGRLYDVCQIMGLPTTANKATIKARYKHLSTAEHPDKKATEFTKVTGADPSDTDRQIWNFEFRLIDESAKRMLQVIERREMSQKYLGKGRKAYADVPVQLNVGQLADLIGEKKLVLAKRALKHVGYPGVIKATVVPRDIAWAALGAIADGAVEDIAAPEEKASKTKKRKVKVPDEKGLELLKAAYLSEGRLKFNGRDAKEVVAELKEAEELHPNWPND